MNNKVSIVLIYCYLMQVLEVSTGKHYSLATTEVTLYKHRLTINCMAKAYDID